MPDIDEGDPIDESSNFVVGLIGGIGISSLLWAVIVYFVFIY